MRFNASLRARSMKARSTPSLSTCQEKKTVSAMSILVIRRWRPRQDRRRSDPQTPSRCRHRGSRRTRHPSRGHWMLLRANPLVLVLLGLFGVCGASTSGFADVFGSYTCNPSFSDCSGTVPVNGGNFDLVSNTTTTGASGLYLQITGTLALSKLLTLSAEY